MLWNRYISPCTIPNPVWNLFWLTGPKQLWDYVMTDSLRNCLRRCGRLQILIILSCFPEESLLDSAGGWGALTLLFLTNSCSSLVFGGYHVPGQCRLLQLWPDANPVLFPSKQHQIVMVDYWVYTDVQNVNLINSKLTLQHKREKAQST